MSEPEQLQPTESEPTKLGPAVTKKELPVWRIRLKKVHEFASRNHLFLALIGLTILAVVWPAPGIFFGSKVNGQSPMQYFLIIIVFFASGLKLKTNELKQALREYLGYIWGTFSTLFVTQCIGIALTRITAFPGPIELKNGMIIYWAMPATVSSSVVLTQQAGGNGTLALLLVIITNLSAVFLIPPMLLWLAEFNNASGVSLNIGSTILKLVETILVPLVAGKILSLFAPVSSFVERNPTLMKIIGIYGVVLLPWLSISSAKSSGQFDKVDAGSVFTVIGWTSMMHLLFLFINFIAVFVLRLCWKAKIAVVITASQKSLSVAISVLTFLPAEFGNAGLISLAMIIGQLTQIAMDSVMVGKLADISKRKSDEASSSIDEPKAVGDVTQLSHLPQNSGSLPMPNWKESVV